MEVCRFWTLLREASRSGWPRFEKPSLIVGLLRIIGCADPQLAGVDRDTIAAQLREVGFDDERQTHTVGSLSGGWKMKLELARAMLYKADLLMLDEPTNHVSLRLRFPSYTASGEHAFESWSEDLNAGAESHRPKWIDDRVFGSRSELDNSHMTISVPFSEMRRY